MPQPLASGISALDTLGRPVRDLREMLRAGATDKMLDEMVSELWTNHGDRYSETRASHTLGLHKVEMSYLGG